MFRDPTTAQAVNPTDGDVQIYTQLKQVTVTNRANSAVMDQWTGLMAPTAER